MRARMERFGEESRMEASGGWMNPAATLNSSIFLPILPAIFLKLPPIRTAGSGFQVKDRAFRSSTLPVVNSMQFTAAPTDFLPILSSMSLKTGKTTFGLHSQAVFQNSDIIIKHFEILRPHRWQAKYRFFPHLL